VIAIILFGAGAYAGAQQAPTTMAFEVATIKPAAPFDPKVFGPRVNQARATYTYMTLKYLTARAYDVKLLQVSGPEWISSEKYDIVATLPEGAKKEDEKRMLQSLLKERFKLTFHIEKRDEDTYVLIVGKHGAKLKPSPSDSPAPVTGAPLKPGESYIEEGDRKTKLVMNKNGASTIDMGKKGTQTIKIDSESMIMHYERSKMTMEDLAGYLPICMGAGGLEKYTVVDQTGIKGFYQVALDYPIGTPQPNRSAAGGNASDMIPSDPQGGESLNQSLDALGLKLEKRKALIDVYIIDHAEKVPTEN
jgi:uncharacterized protein (TIGR03435 family)